jgi:hypothetical protein
MALVVVVGALLACKKKEEQTAPSATAAPEPTPAQPITPPPETAAPAASAAPSATAEPAATTPTTTKPKPKPSASAPASAVPSAKPPPSASAAPSASAPPPNTTASYNEIQRCCGALSAEAKKPGLSQNQYKAAAATCGGIAQQVKAGKADAAAAKTLIRAQLHGVAIPPGC